MGKEGRVRGRKEGNGMVCHQRTTGKQFGHRCQMITQILVRRRRPVGTAAVQLAAGDWLR